MDINRKTAYFTLMDIEQKKQYSNLALNHHILCMKPTSQGFVRELVYGVLENKYLIDYIINQLIPKDVSKVKKQDLTILRMGIYQIAKMNSVPEYAAVNESVMLAKKFARGREKFVNGVLRSYISNRFSINLPKREDDEIRYLSVKYSYEPWIVKLWLSEYDVEFVEKLLEEGNKTPGVTIRLNWLKGMKRDVIKGLEERGFEVEQGKLCSNALHVKGGDLLDTGMYKMGVFSIQDEASQLVVNMLEPNDTDVVMDVCAAPGGKTLAIAEAMNNKGTVIARDIYKRKVEIINKEAKRLGLTNVQTGTWDAAKLDSSMVEQADKVLVDAPCSGLGVIRRKPEIKYKKLTEELRLLPVKQLSILKTAAKYVKPGGILMYSTCTINSYENQKVVADFLRNNSRFDLIESRQLLPHVDGADGFYICKMIKKDSII
ncbi:MAG: 16S rRNA (cytosine(967)-C(5))-methyltransferase RsmB [Anaerovoracaceae bacterium]